MATTLTSQEDVRSISAARCTPRSRPPTPEHEHTDQENPEWCDVDSIAFPILKAVDLYPYGSYFHSSDYGLMPCYVLEVLKRHDDTAWVVDRINSVATFRKHRTLINPAFAPLDAVQGLDTPWGVYYTIPSPDNLQLRWERPLAACFVMTGAVSDSHLKSGYTSRNKRDSTLRTDKRISIWPFEDVYQRTFAYLAAVAHKTKIAFKFSGGQITFVTGKRDDTSSEPPTRSSRKALTFGSLEAASTSANQEETLTRTTLPRLSTARGPRPFLVRRGEDMDNLQPLRTFDFPVALRYETDIPIFNATNHEINFNDWTWEVVTTLPLWRGEIPLDALVTVGFTALAAPGSSGVSSLTLPLQFVVVHYA